MRIVNNDSENRSWFVYNENDGAQIIALASGPLNPGGSTEFFVPSNSNGLYAVLIKRNSGGGPTLDSATGKNSQTFTFDGSTLKVS